MGSFAPHGGRGLVETQRVTYTGVGPISRISRGPTAGGRRGSGRLGDRSMESHSDSDLR